MTLLFFAKIDMDVTFSLVRYDLDNSLILIMDICSLLSSSSSSCPIGRMVVSSAIVVNVLYANSEISTVQSRKRTGSKTLLCG